jgi:chromosome segregation ATPase
MPRKTLREHLHDANSEIARLEELQKQAEKENNDKQAVIYDLENQLSESSKTIARVQTKLHENAQKLLQSEAVREELSLTLNRFFTLLAQNGFVREGESPLSLGKRAAYHMAQRESRIGRQSHFGKLVVVFFVVVFFGALMVMPS